MEKMTVAIVGTGMIGGSLAALFAGNGHPVTVLATGEPSIRRGLEHFDRIYGELEQRGLATPQQTTAARGRLRHTLDYRELSQAEVLYECVGEQLAQKQAVYRNLEEHCPRARVVASATSALHPDDLAGGSGLADRILVAHPFNPPHVVPFVELVRGRETSDEAVELMREFLESCGKRVVVMKKAAPGFIAGRLQQALVREAYNLLQEGYADARDIDLAAMYSFMPRYTAVGIFEHQDAAGLDTSLAVKEYLFPELCNDREAPAMLQELCAQGKTGMKAGQGIYTWSPADRASFARRAAEPYWRFFSWSLPDE